MSSEIDKLRERVSSRGYAEIADVEEVERLAAAVPSAALQILLGDLIQLLEIPGRYELADSERAYLRAMEIDSTNADAHASLGFFYDAVMDDPAKAKPFFEQAIVLGSAVAEEALESVREQLRDG